MKPSKITLWLLAAWVLLGILTAFIPKLAAIWTIYAAVLIIALVVDGIAVYTKPNLKIIYKIDRNLPIYSWYRVKQYIQNQTQHNLHLLARDHYPVSFMTKELPAAFRIAPNQSIELQYKVKPLSRGSFEFSGTDILRRSPIHLWFRKFFYDHKAPVRVFPNFANISKYILLAADNHLSQLGIKKKQRRGEGNDFHQLREYHVGDSLNQIDWKASSRFNKLISKEYQDERDQRIIFLLDCGRRMRHADEEFSHLDQAINAMLLLGYVAIQQGDSIGFKAFAGDDRWVPPQKGPKTITNLLHKTYDLPSTLASADYLQAAQELIRLRQKRSLVVLISNTRDDDYENLAAAIQLLSLRHLVILADLKESVLDERSNQTVADLDSALQFHTVKQYLHLRKEHHRQLRHLGVLSVDATAENLPIYLINEYLNIKRSGML